MTLPSALPEAGMGRLLIGAVDGSMEVIAQTVERFTGASTLAVRVGQLCRAPCATDLPTPAQPPPETVGNADPTIAAVMQPPPFAPTP